MNDDKRATPRKYLKYPAQIDFGDGAGARRCALTDVSVTGARVLIGESDKPPSEVTLLFGRDSVGRRCQVVWHRDKELGLKFLVPADGKLGFQNAPDKSRRESVP